MIHQALLRLIITATTLGVAVAAYADATPPRWESVRLNPKLIGFEAFTPDGPPRKFRRRAATGTMYFAFWGAALPAGGALEQYRDEWQETEEHDRHDYAGLKFAEKADASRRHRAMTPAFPLVNGGERFGSPDIDWYDGLVNLPPDINPPTATHREMVGCGITAPITNPAGYGKAQGEYSEDLSVEDTEADALARIKLQLELPPEQRAKGAIQAGVEAVAYFTKRTTTAGWVIQKTRHVATFQASGAGQSVFRVDYRVGGEKRGETFTVAHPSSGTITVVVDATPQPYLGLFENDARPDHLIRVDQPDREYTIEGVSLAGAN